MVDCVIANTIINSPYLSEVYSACCDDRVTGRIVDGRLATFSFVRSERPRRTRERPARNAFSAKLRLADTKKASKSMVQ